MINFTIDKIQLRNVRRYGDEMMEMDFPVNNLTVFTGKVGAGKSTMFKAVSMALYGEDGGAKNEKLSIDDMINEKNGKNLEIHLYFHSTVDDNPTETKYEIHLFHKHSKYNNKLVFVKDGKDISLESKTATYELIEKTIIPKNVYHNVYYFTQQCKNFFTSIPNSEQKEIFNAILDLSEYKSYYENAKNCIIDTDKQLALSLNDLNNKQTLLTERNQSLDSIKQQRNDYELKSKEEVKSLSKLVSDLKEKIDVEKTLIDDTIDTRITNLKLEYEKKKLDFEHKIANKNSELTKLNDDFRDTTVPNLKSKYVRIRLEKSKDLDTELNEKNIALNKNLSIIKQEESECEKRIMQDNEDVSTEYDKKIGKIREECDKIKSDNARIEKETYNKLTELKDNTIKDADVLKQTILHEENTVSSINDEINDTIADKEKLTKQLEDYKKSLNDPDAVCSLCGQKLVNKDHVQKHIESTQLDIKNCDGDIERFKSDLEKANAILNEHKVKLQDLKTKFESEKAVIKDECQNILNKNNETEKVLGADILCLENELCTIKENNRQKNLKIFEDKVKSLNVTCDEIRNDINRINKEKENIDNTLRQEYSVEFNKLKNVVSTTEYEIKNEIELVNAELKDLNIKYNHEINNLNTIQETNNNREINIGKMECDIIKYNQEIESLSKPEKLKQYDDMSIQLEKSIKNTEADLENTKKTHKSLEYTMNVLNFWKTAFSDSGIKSMLIDSAIPHMNECVTEELNRVAPGKFTVSFDTLSETKSGKVKDKFNINIVNNETQSNGHKKLSGGEKRIIDLCCMCALRSLAEKLYGKRFCHIFYDEILDSLDDECKQQFCANVKYQSTNGCNVTLITHDLPEDVDPDRVFPF